LASQPASKPVVHIHHSSHADRTAINPKVTKPRTNFSGALVIRRRCGLTRRDKTAPKFPDLIKRDFTATAVNKRWVGDMTEIPTEDGKLYLATVIDLYSRRLLGAATSSHPDAELACAAIRMAVAARGGKERIKGVIFHTDYAEVCVKPRIHGLACSSGVGWRISRLNVSSVIAGCRGFGVGLR
jgi:putative transposase